MKRGRPLLSESFSAMRSAAIARGLFWPPLFRLFFAPNDVTRTIVMLFVLLRCNVPHKCLFLVTIWCIYAAERRPLCIGTKFWLAYLIA